MDLDREGRFRITNDLLQDESAHENLKKIMGHMFIVRCEYLYEHMSFEYVAISDLFEHVGKSIHAPMYEIIMTDGNIKANKV